MSSTPFGVLEGTSYDVIDTRFRTLFLRSMRVERLWSGGLWTEGPVYFPAHRSLVFSDIPNDRLLRYDETTGAFGTFRQPSNNANGNTLDHHGRLVTCEHLTRRVTRTEHDGRLTVLADRFNGKRLNSPNDVVVRSDGSIWFTDPRFGISSPFEGEVAESEIGKDYVFRIDPLTGALTAVVTDMVRPNGLAFSPDETTLYIADSWRGPDGQGSGTLRAFQVSGDGTTLSGGKLFATCTAGRFDGFRVDAQGYIWSSADDGVHVLHPEKGDLIGRIRLPEIVSNLTFGGAKRNRLYITTNTSLYAAYTNARGCAPG
jgi:gluconolactonase